jgi:hypothetical protein
MSAGVKLYEKTSGRTIVICPNCREDNAPTFRFCGMCGTSLEARPDARRPAGAPVPSMPMPKIAHAPEPLRPVVVENATRSASSPAPSLSGPSVLGLNQPGAYQPVPNQPSTDALRERAFSGLDSFFEPEQPKTGGRRILLMVALLAALGGAAWWTYTNYLGVTDGRKPEPAASSAGEASAEKQSTQAGTQDAAPAPAANSSQAAVPSAAVPSAAVPSGRVPESQTENASAGPDATRKTADAAPKPTAEAKPVTPPPVAPAKTTTKTVPADRVEARREPGVTSAKPSPMPATADTGDADFRKGEAYLYGRGAGENCAEAVKYLKAASAKSNAKARSAFGTMYATGHCVPRDLPTSYLWFALALQVDPNNQILEKDLSAIWNQMTPPERQMATRMKQ